MLDNSRILPKFIPILLLPLVLLAALVNTLAVWR